MQYDFVCVGGGPSGLTTVYCLGELGYKCLLIDKNSSIGGCHRVARVDGLFTEHSPRIYSDSYENMIMILTDMGYNFTDFFTPYKFNVGTFSSEAISVLTLRESGLIVWEYLKLFFNKNHGARTSMNSFTTTNAFSSQAVNYIDRLCRLSDGAGIDRYSLFQFLELFNQQAMYGIYQPKLPNDIGLLAKWQEKIMGSGNVTIMLNSEVIAINSNTNENINKGKTIESITIYDSLTQTKTIINGKKFILAIPPVPLVDLLKKSSDAVGAFGDVNSLSTWAVKNDYNRDISVAFHWNTELNLSDIYGFPSSDWNIAFIKLSDYMDFQDLRSKTVISTTITKTDSISKFNNKTADECTADELIAEAFRQLKLTFTTLPSPSAALMYPGITKVDGMWKNVDTAFVRTSDDTEIKSRSDQFCNLYNLGTHNGHNMYHFTSFESAVENSLHLVHKLVPCSKERYPMRRLKSLSKTLKFIVIGFIIALIVWKSIYLIPGLVLFSVKNRIFGS